MRYYIIDDNLATVRTLANIVRMKKLGTVAGASTDPLEAMEEIIKEEPDIVLVDLLMSGIDGITLVKKIREKNDRIAFVMISKVSDKEMIQRAYSAGIEFFINKPVSIIEVETVLSNVAETVKMKGLLGNIRNLFQEDNKVDEKENHRKDSFQNMDILLGALGMLGEKGTQDIRFIFGKMLETSKGYDRNLIESCADEMGDTAKNIEQRIRRAVKKGLSNAAAMGLDDYECEAFSVYARYVFDFKTLRDEMNLLSGKSDSGGRASIAGFFEGLMLYVNSF